MDQLLKVEGTSNDFLLGTGIWAERLAGDPELVARLCHRRRGLGADGTLALTAEGPDRVRLLYRNSDGSHALFCANGCRCAARAAVELLGLPRTLVVATDWVDIPAEVNGEQVTLELPAPSELPQPYELRVGQRTWHGTLLHFRDPHLAILGEPAIEQLDLVTLGPLLGHHPGLDPEGANITFLTIGDDNSDGSSDSDSADAFTRTWEKGIEAETMSCGSGLVAAVLTGLIGRRQRRVHCLTGGGDLLQVAVLGEPPRCTSLLTGPARFVAKVEPTPEMLRG